MSSHEGSMAQEFEDKVAKQALAQKRHVSNLNTRLEVYVRNMNGIKKENARLKKDIARLEMEYSAKMNQQKKMDHDTIDSLRSELESVSADKDVALQELADANGARKDYEERLISSESLNASLRSETESMRADIQRLKEELDALRKNNASLRYKHQQFDAERKAMAKQNKETKKNNERMVRAMAKLESDRSAEKATFQAVLVEKNEEIDRLLEDSRSNEVTQDEMRREFDQKLADYVAKREAQYKVEKGEWMRIFKDEFNRKLASFKEANRSLGDENVALSQQQTELRNRISKLKQQKTELEVTRKSNEEEIERRIDDLDVLRRAKDAEIHEIKGRLDTANDRFKAKEIEFDELSGIKMQLDAEIELYRSILNEAEEACGYRSPLDAKYTNNNSRKRRRVMTPGVTPMGHGVKVVTPGLSRAAKNAETDLIGSFPADPHSPEMKDAESESVDSGTPGDAEGAALHFSGLDLNRGMIEIQNISKGAVSLNGYTLANSTGTAQFQLPKGMVLDNGHRLRVYVGEKYLELEQGGDGGETDTKELCGDYNGAFTFWTKNVWDADEADCARLYDPSHEEVATLEISPEMVDRDAAQKGCAVM